MRTDEANQSLWLLVLSPCIWAIHFVLCYGTASVWCAKVVARDESLYPVRAAIAAYTTVAFVGIAIVGWMGHRRHRLGHAELPHDADTPEDRHRFLGFAAVLLSVLSAIAVLFVGLVAVFFDVCN